MRNMMLQVRNLSKIILCTLLLLAAGCKDKCDPFVDPGTIENPDWVLTVDTTDLTVSMTAVVKVSFAQSEGSLAAFMGNDCCGIADYNADLGLYWLYISPATEMTNDQLQMTDVVLRFYSPDLKRIFGATSTFPFRNDTQLGTVAEPYTPEWEVTK